MPPAAAAADPRDCRAWLRDFSRTADRRLPRGSVRPLISEELVDANGKPIDVMAHFKTNPKTLDSMWCNAEGLKHTAQVSGGEHTKLSRVPAWPGYREVWIPVRADLSLCGQMGLAGGAIAGAEPGAADCIVILPGFLGHNGVQRSRDIADGLRASGFHVVSLEMRGHGQTEARYPNVAHTFGTLEAVDLLLAAEWLQALPYVRRTGLLGFCWGANQALLAAWYDGRTRPHPSITPSLESHLGPVSDRSHFAAGVIAFSPVLRFEEIIDSLDVPRSSWMHPILASLQGTVRSRMELKGYAHPDGSLRRLIDEEYARSELSYPGSVRDGLRFLRLLPYKQEPDGDKFLAPRVPVLIVQAANDPLAGAQAVADFMARKPNRNVAAVVIAGGGHIGFAPYAQSYYYSLMVNFFDSATGPRGMEPTRLVARDASQP